MKLEKWALIAEICGGVAIFFTLVILVIEVNGNTAATITGNRQSLATRVEQLLLAEANPDVAAAMQKARSGSELTAVESTIYASVISANLRLAEEAFLQYRDGQLSEEYWLTRSKNLVEVRLRRPQARRLWARYSEGEYFTRDYTEWLDEAIAETYGE